MARYDVYAVRGGDFLVDVRAEAYDGLSRLVAVPLLAVHKAPTPIAGLNPVLVFRGASYVLMTQYITSVPRQRLGIPVDNLDACWDDILRALDFLITGF